MTNDVPLQEEVPSPQPTKLNVKRSFFLKVFLAIAILILLPIFFIIGRFYYTHYLVVTTNHGTISVFDKEPTPLPTSIATPTPEEIKVILKDTNTNQEITRISPYGEDYIATWGKYLFFKENSTLTNIIAYDMTTGQQLVYDYSLVRDDPKDSLVGLSSIQVVGNDLYINFGGYMQEGSMHYMPLPPQTSTFTYLSTGRNPRIEKLHNQYFITGGDGDSCWGESDYSLFNPETKKITHIVTSHHGCNYGDEFFDFASDGLMLIANHVEDPSSTIMIDAGYTNAYKYIYGVNTTISTEKIMLLPEEQMPKGIHSLSYLKDKNQFVLYGPAIYTFDVDTKKLTKITDIPPEFTKDYSSVSWKDNYLCTYDYNTSQNIAYDITEKKLVPFDSQCTDKTQIPTPDPPYQEVQKQKILDKLEELNLPNNIQIL